MGREIRRVPLDFDWPLEKIWGGFLNPHANLAKDCPACEGSGSAPEVRRMIVGEGYSYEAAKTFRKSGWAPSALAVKRGPDAGFYRDIESARFGGGPSSPEVP